MAGEATHGAAVPRADRTGSRRVEGSGRGGLRKRVNLTGPLQAAGAAELRKLKLSSADSELVRSQGAFVNADRVTVAR
jgi:hypothetical protein